MSDCPVLTCYFELSYTKIMNNSNYTQANQKHTISNKQLQIFRST